MISRATSNPFKLSSYKVAAVPGLLALVLLLLPLCWSTTAQAVSLTAKVDRTSLSVEETLSLTVTYSDSVFSGSPDFTPLQQDFEILSNQRSSQVRSINGQVEASTVWTVTLAPRRQGKLTIPPLSYKGVDSAAISLTVTAAGTLSSDRPVFLETELDQNSVYVQQQLLMTIRLFTSIDLREVTSEQLKIDNAVVKSLSETQYTRVVNGRTYGVVEVRYGIFPQQSGQLEIPATTWNIVQRSGRSSGFGFDPMFSSSGKRLRLRSEPLSADVKPQPDSYLGDTWLPANDVTLTQYWSRSPKEFRVGEPISRKLTLEAEGVLSSLLPEIQLPATDGIRYYPDQPQLSETVDSGTIRSTQVQSYAVVPTVEGELTLPPVTVSWWDTETQQQRQSTIPAQTILVAPSATPIATPDSATDAAIKSQATPPLSSDVPSDSMMAPSPAQQKLWFTALLLLVATNLLTLWLWLRARRQSHASRAEQAPNPESTEKSSWKALKRSCRSGSPLELSQLLIAWSRHFSGDPQIRSLEGVRRRLPSLSSTVLNLQQCLYNNRSSDFDREQFLSALTEARMTPHRSLQENSADSLIPPLYPSSP